MIISEKQLDQQGLNVTEPAFGPINKIFRGPEDEFVDGVEEQGLMGAAASRENIIGSELDRQEFEDQLLSAKNQGDTPDYHPLQDMPDRHRAHIALYANEAVNKESADVITRRLDQQVQDELTLNTAGVPGVAARMAAAVFDPTNAVYIPITWLSKMGTFGKVALGGSILGGGQATQEALLHHANNTRTVEESNIAIGSAFVIGGILGPILSRSKLMDEAIAELSDIARGQTRQFTVAHSPAGPVKIGINKASIGKKFDFTRLDCP